MKEIKTLAILVVLVAVLYWMIEPFAHTRLSPHVDPANYDFAAEDITLATTNVEKAQKALETAQNSGDEGMIASATRTLQDAKNQQDKVTLFWDEINKIDIIKGDATRGADTFMNAGCVACHGVNKLGMDAPMDATSASEAYGVNPPDLSSAGYLYSPKFLAALIKDPTMAMKLDHKFGDENPHPMPAFYGLGDDINQEIADIVAYLRSIAPSAMENAQVFEDSCQRCHDVKYAGRKVTSDMEKVAAYMGSTPPDLSMMIRSKLPDYLHEFINDTQKKLPGTSMPRVGLTQEAENQVVAYLEEVGDSKKDEREKTALYIMLYFAILSVFAGLWKSKVWSKLH
ncbi:c-type cytochrome [Campylobacter sp. JMF_06 NA1]|uniref:c-type cytochrome n=1 Tax=Campylobacter sp. JMF_06 NA1 TaxID=2983823 RepID=UPI0022E9E7E8|nr:c-type cytochrome [Campylobacter sp. JMF_06 NA1]MDA3078687.1 c-type cytochrome [Campylobacter sp. JMF_06 NA1]